MTESASRIAIIDFEASALPGKGRRSFPIEVGVGIPETGAVRSWLIRPERVCLDEWDWYYESEQVHRLTREYLLKHGLPRELVAREMQDFIGGRDLVSDNSAAEGYWLGILYGEEQPRDVGSLMLVYAATMGVGDRGRAAYARAEEHARKMAPRTHRAADDVRHELVKLRELVKLIRESDLRR